MICSCTSEQEKLETEVHFSRTITQHIEAAYNRIDKTQIPYPYNSEKAKLLEKKLEDIPFS
ncbi:MAG: hypothetical protein AAF599_15975, partial [Bacteroidota bacterium]